MVGFDFAVFWSAARAAIAHDAECVEWSIGFPGRSDHGPSMNHALKNGFGDVTLARLLLRFLDLTADWC